MIIKTDKRGFEFDKAEFDIPKRSAFPLEHENKLTFNMGKLIPIMCEEVLPGDKFTVDVNAFIRFQPMVAPIMHRVDTYVHFFFVPNRLIWKDWENFITPGAGNTLMSDLKDYVVPEKPYFTPVQMDSDLYNVSSSSQMNARCPFVPGSLGDYLGINCALTDLQFDKYDEVFKSGDSSVSFTSHQKLDLLPFIAYHKVCDDYYRNPSLELPVVNDRIVEHQGLLPSNDDGDLDSDFLQLFNLRTRNWEKDYFTSCLPTPQAGKPVILDGGDVNMSKQNFQLQLRTTGVNVGDYLRVTSIVDTDDSSSQGAHFGVGASPTSTPANNVVPASFRIESTDGESLVLPSTAISINALRRASALQEWLEKQARAGQRYIDSIKAHFGVISSDARLQRAEYIGGGKQAVTISSVEQTSSTNDVTPQGNLAGKAISAGGRISCQYGEAEEHGFVIGIMSVMPKTGYYQGLSKKWLRFDLLDYAFPNFAHLGEQEVKQLELFFSISNNTTAGTKVDDLNETTFGYIPRYSDYKYLPDEVHGDFKSSLQFWHLARKFANPPRLNASFVQADPRKDVFAVMDENVHSCLAELWIDYKSIRPLPKFSTPKII